MFIFFRNGTSVWLHDAKNCGVDGGTLTASTSRGRAIAEFQLAHVAFWCYDHEKFTTYGFPANADEARL